MGLDIGSGFVKIAEVDHGGDCPELSRAAMRPMPRGAVVDGEVVDPLRVVDAVHEVLDDAGMESAEVVTALGGHDVFIKKVEMPRTKGSDAHRAIRREAERHVPFDIESVQLDFQILRNRDAGSRMDVLLVAAKRERVEERVALLAEAGVKVALMDVEAFALHNAFAHNYPGAATGVVALVNVGHEITNISIQRDGAPALTRDFPVGSGRLGASLRAERGSSADGPDRARDSVADNIAMGIERVFALLRTHRPGTGVGRIFLSGGGACTPGIPEALARGIKVETHLVNPFQRVRVRAGACSDDVVGEAAPMLLLALGLALRAPGRGRRTSQP